MYSKARALAAELQAAMRASLMDGYIFVLPTTPGPAPPAAAGAGGASGGEAQAAQAFRARCAQFAAVAALSGVPQVVLPLPVPGGMPLSVSLLALHKRDLVLLQAAAKLGPMLADEAAALVAERNNGDQPWWRPQAPAPAEAAATATGDGGKKPAGSSRANGRRKKADSALDAATAAAEAFKEDGNAAFRAGRYDDAVRQYGAAIQLRPQAAVYHANRAMAYLKLGSYGAAEADCDAALKLELSAKALLRRGSARLAQVGAAGGHGCAAPCCNSAAVAAHPLLAAPHHHTRHHCLTPTTHPWPPQGNADGAKADFRQVLALEPQNRQAREELRGIEAMEGAASGVDQLGPF